MSLHCTASRVMGKTSIEMICPYEPGRPIEEVKRTLGLSRVIKLASNENPVGPSPRVLQTLAESTLDLHLYPDCEGWYLREALARELGLRPEELLLGAGSADLMGQLANAYLEPGLQAVVADLCFPVYANVVHTAGAQAVQVPLTGSLDFDLERFLGAVTTSTRVVFLASPNNPTGRLIPHADLVQFLERLPAHVLCVLDLAYCEYVESPAEHNPMRLLERHSNLIVLRTFSKVYGLAGLRIGYAAANPDVLACLRRVRIPFNTSTAAQVAARAALLDRQHVQRSIEVNNTVRDCMLRQLHEMGLSPVPSHANFVLVPLGADPEPLFEALLRRGIIVRPMRHPRLAGCLRITTGTEAQNDEAMGALAELVRAGRVARCSDEHVRV